VTSPASHAPATRVDTTSGKHWRAATEGFLLGIAYDVASLFIANPYIVGAGTVLLVAVAAARFRGRQLPWIALASALAANPVNLDASVSCNVVVAFGFLLLGRPQLTRVPPWLLGATAVGLASAFASVASWRGGLTPENAFTQAASLANYLLGPFLLLPVLYSGVGDLDEPGVLIKGLVAWLILPSLLLLTAARALGVPVSDVTPSTYQLEIFTVYRLVNVDVVVTRTQVGIVLAALACASFALSLSRLSARWRAVTLAAVITSVALILVTGSVGSVIAMILGGIVVIVGTVRRRSVAIPVLIASLGTAAIAKADLFLPPELYQYVHGRYMERFSAGSGIGATDRVERWVKSLEFAADHPTGVGWSLYVDELADYPHNDFISYAIAWGVLCGVAYLFAVVRTWLSYSTGAPKSDDLTATLGLAGLGAATVLLVNSMADHLTANRWYFNVVWSVVWYCYFSARSARRAQP
jgi:hypothetical protein